MFRRCRAARRCSEPPETTPRVWYVFQGGGPPDLYKLSTGNAADRGEISKEPRLHLLYYAMHGYPVGERVCLPFDTGIQIAFNGDSILAVRISNYKRLRDRTACLRCVLESPKELRTHLPQASFPTGRNNLDLWVSIADLSNQFRIHLRIVIALALNDDSKATVTHLEEGPCK